MPGAESNRMSNYKNKGKSGDELRKKRTEVSVELRKKGRDDQLLKRRNIALDDEGEDANEINANTASYQNGGTGKAPTPMPTLEEIVKGVVWLYSSTLVLILLMLSLAECVYHACITRPTPIIRVI